MEYLEHQVAVEAELDSMVESLKVVQPSTAVPTCPGWTIADLAKHVGEFCGFWTHVLCEATGREKTPFTDEPDGESFAGWLRRLGDHLLEEMRLTPSDKHVWTWHEDDRSAAFVARRCANELAIHRYDAQSAGDTTSAIAPDLAADGIDELLTVLVTAVSVRDWLPDRASTCTRPTSTWSGS